MRIRLEVSSMASHQRSGVANYTGLLLSALSQAQDTSTAASYFNFLGRQVDPDLPEHTKRERCVLFPLRVYAKLQSHRLALPFDLLKRPVDLTIHPNFALWPTINSKKTMVVVHDLTYIHYPEYVEKNNLPHLRRVVPRAIAKADCVVTVSETVRSEIIEKFNVPASRCIATPIPPDDSFFEPVIRDAHTRYDIPTKEYFLFLGNLEPRKNLAALVRAYEKLPQETTDRYSLVICGGKGWGFEETQRVIDEAKSRHPNIRQIGYADQVDLPSLYRQASLFISPSHYEGFGMPVLEALAAGCKVLTSDIPVFREAGGEVIDYVDPANSQVFANQIMKSIQKDFDGEAVSKHLKTFSWENNARKIIDWFHNS